MAHTTRGNLTGKAASVDIAQRRAEIEEDRFYYRPNGLYWEQRQLKALYELADYPVLVEIWDSGLIPSRATYKRLYELATWLLQYRDVVPEFCVWPPQ